MENCGNKIAPLVMLPDEHAVDDDEKIIRIIEEEHIGKTICTPSSYSNGFSCSFPLNFLSYYEKLEDCNKRDKLERTITTDHKTGEISHSRCLN